MADEEASSYIDYETFLDPTFSASSFANTLVLATNNSTDTPLDLKTPLSRVLFDVQEIDTLLDSLTSQSALPLLLHTQKNVEAGTHLLDELQGQVAALSEGYDRLRKEVIERYDAAEETRLVAERLWETVRLGRQVGRCLTLGRQLETQINDVKQSVSKKEDYRAIVRGATTLQAIRATLRDEGEDLSKIATIRTVQIELVEPSDKLLTNRAEQIVSQFSMSALSTKGADAGFGKDMSTPTYAQSEDAKSSTTAALISLYLLSPVKAVPAQQYFEPSRLVEVLQNYLKRAITSSLAGLSSALAALPKLERTLLEISARCQNIAALEMLLESIKPPEHPLLASAASNSTSDDEESETLANQGQTPQDLLQPVLASLDTSSLPSYFWRTMASQLSGRVQKIIRDGGVSARTLRTNRDRVRDALRECVNRGSQLPASSLSRGKGLTVRNWEREAAVMTGALNAALGR